MSKELSPVPYPKGFESKFESMLANMTEAMLRQFRNETLNKLNKGTIAKFDGTQFEDAQTGNYASAFMGLAKPAKRKILKRFDDERIDREVKKILLSLNKVNQKSFYEKVEGAIGVSVQQMIGKEGLTPQINALIIETQEWVKKHRDDNLAYFTNNSLRVMSGNADLDEVMKSYNAEGKKRVDHAKFTARTQLANFNGMSNKIRAQKLGIKEAVWVTAKDERVRPSHEDRGGKTFELSEGLYSSVDSKALLPGEDYQCRCIYRMILPTQEDE